MADYPGQPRFFKGFGEHGAGRLECAEKDSVTVAIAPKCRANETQRALSSAKPDAA